MKMPFEFAKKKLLASILICYVSILIVSSINKIFAVSFLGGDLITTVYQLLSRFNIQDILPLKLFVFGSFALSFLYPVVIMLFLFIYGIIIQIILLIFNKDTSRFSNNMGLIFYTIANIYPLTLLPFIGGLLYSCFFIYILSREFASENLISVSKGVLLLCSPFILLILVILGLALALASIFSSLL